MKRAKILGVVLAVFCVSTVAAANPLDFQLPGPEALRGLELTEEQKEQLKAIRENLGKELKPLGEELREKVKELRELFQAEEIDAASIKTKAAEISGIRGTLMQTTVEAFIDVSQVLTLEQRKELQKRMKERRDKPGAGGRGGPPGPRERWGREGDRDKGRYDRKPGGPRYRQDGRKGEGPSRWREHRRPENEEDTDDSTEE